MKFLPKALCFFCFFFHFWTGYFSNFKFTKHVSACINNGTDFTLYTWISMRRKCCLWCSAALIKGYAVKNKTKTAEQIDNQPFVCKVCLVSHQHDDDITSPLCSDIINPLCSLLERVDVWIKTKLFREKPFLFRKRKICKFIRFFLFFFSLQWN